MVGGRKVFPGFGACSGPAPPDAGLSFRPKLTKQALSRACQGVVLLLINKVPPPGMDSPPSRRNSARAASVAGECVFSARSWSPAYERKRAGRNALGGGPTLPARGPCARGRWSEELVVLHASTGSPLVCAPLLRRSPGIRRQPPFPPHCRHGQR